MNAAILALGLYKESGGVNKSVRAFQRALNAQVISWVDPNQVREQQLIWNNSSVVHGSRLPILRHMLYPAHGETVAAEGIMAQADLVSCHSFWRWHNPWLRRVARTRRVPYWFVPHGGLDPYVFQTGRWAKKLFLRCVGTRFIREAACVIFSTRREMEKAAPWCPARRTEIIYWPLEDQDFAVVRNRELGRAVREQYGIPLNHRCLLYFGRLHPMKRPLETIDAVAAAGRDDVHLFIVGNEFGVSLSECRQRAAQRGIASRVHVVGPVYGQKVADYLSAADAYISLSWRENFNFTAAEALAAGLPLVLSPGNDLATELTGVACGWMLKDDRFETVAEAVRDIADQPQLRLDDMGKQGSNWARRELTFEIFQSRLKQLGEIIISQ